MTARRARSPERLITRIKLRQLALVIALSERRSLRQAASDVAVTQPAATKLLRDLEQAVGVPLFTRHPWGVAPTDYGVTLVRYARAMLTELGEARSEIAARAAGATGQVRTGGVTGAMPDILAPAIRRMRSERPGVRLFVLVNTSEVLLDALRQGTLDVAVCPVPPHADVSALDVSPFGEEPLRVVARADHPFARRKSIPPAKLADAPWILQPSTSPLRRDAEAMLAGAGLRLPAAITETVSIVATLALLQDGDALTVMPQALARHYARFGMLTELDVKLARPASRYDLVTRAQRGLSAAAAAFVAMLKQSAAPR